MTSILHIIGARPQFIKAAMVVKALPAYKLESFIIHTKQHYDQYLSDVFFDNLDLPAPDVTLDVESGSHGYL